MHRTTILLTEELHRAAEQEAREMGLSLSELIRRRLSPALQKKKEKVPAFFARAPWCDRGPSDFSVRHDEHLYGS
jgi:hypothetical protein